MTQDELLVLAHQWFLAGAHRQYRQLSRLCPMARVEYRTMCPQFLLDWCKRRVSRRALFCSAYIRNIHKMQNMYNIHKQNILDIFSIF